MTEEERQKALQRALDILSGKIKVEPFKMPNWDDTRFRVNSLCTNCSSIVKGPVCNCGGNAEEL